MLVALVLCIFITMVQADKKPMNSDLDLALYDD
jgi:hypothetical protein